MFFQQNLLLENLFFNLAKDQVKDQSSKIKVNEKTFSWKTLLSISALLLKVSNGIFQSNFRSKKLKKES